MAHFHDPYRASSARGDDAPKAAAVAAPQNEEDKVPSGTTKEVLAWVNGDKDRARRALEAEQADSSPRKGVVNELNEILAEDEDTDSK